MTNNRKIINSVFKELRDENLIPTDISFGNGYFIFAMGEDSVVHFHIKGAKGWLFGMWIDTSSEEDAIQFFAQYEETIDKFKPSRSTFVTSVSRKELKNVSDNHETAFWAYINIVKIAKHIKSNPHLAFLQDNGYSLYLDKPLYKEYVAEKFYLYKRRLNKIRKRITDDLFPYCVNNLSAKIVKSWNDEILQDIKVDDLNKGGFICRPRWHVKTYYNRVSANNKIQAAKMCKFTDKINKYHFLFTTHNTSYTDYIQGKVYQYVRRH